MEPSIVIDGDSAEKCRKYVAGLRGSFRAPSPIDWTVGSLLDLELAILHCF